MTKKTTVAVQQLHAMTVTELKRIHAEVFGEETRSKTRRTSAGRSPGVCRRWMKGV